MTPIVVKPSGVEQDCTQDLKSEVRAVARRASHLGGAVSLAFLRGYQAGYEDCVMGRKPECYARTDRQSIEGKDD